MERLNTEFVQSRNDAARVKKDKNSWDVEFSPAQTTLEGESDTGVFLRYWNRESCRFEEFDESLQGRFDTAKSSVVIFHGMDESFEKPWIAVIAERIADMDNEMSIIAVDWSRFSQRESLSEDTLEKIPFVSEKTNQFAPLAENVTNKIPFLSEKTNQFAPFAENVAKKIPYAVEQAYKSTPKPVTSAGKIPHVAELADKYLFDEQHLGLSPESTHLIGFSHGAHLGGMVGTLQEGKIKRLTLLDPSLMPVHLNVENFLGEGWNSGSARFVDMYRTSVIAGTGEARGNKVFYVLEKSGDFHSPISFLPDHLYAPKWFASTINRKRADFGYWISETADKSSSTGDRWTGLIVSTVPKPGDREGLDEASVIVPFSKKGVKPEWMTDTQMYNDVIITTNIEVKETTVTAPGKTAFAHGGQADIQLLLANHFERDVYFPTGIWGFANARAIPGHVWLSESEGFDAKKTKMSIPLSAAGMWDSKQLKFRLFDEEGNKAKASVSVRLPKQSELHKKFGRSDGDFFLHIDLGCVLGSNKIIYDLDESDNFGSVRIRFE